MEKKLVVYSTALFCLLMPMNTKLGNLSLGILIASIVFYLIKSKAGIFITKRELFKVLFLSTGLFILQLTIGLAFTDDFFGGIKYYENYASYLLLPLLFAFLRRDLLEEMLRRGSLYFIWGCLITSIVLLSYNFWCYFQFKDTFVFGRDLFSYDYTYHNFTKSLRFHPTLLGFYLLFALVLLNDKMSSTNQYVRIIANGVLILSLIFINSRSVLLGLFCYLVFVYIMQLRQFFLLKKGGRGLLWMSIGGILSAVSLLAALKDTYMEDRFTNQLRWELSENVGTTYDGEYENDSRLARWIAIADVGQDRFWFGYGSGTEKKVSLEAYEKHELLFAKSQGYGPHNQYLSFFVEYGVFGLLLFLFSMTVQLKLAIRNEQRAYLLLLLFILLGCFFDSILYLNTMIIFVAFFLNLFYFISWKKENI